ncbi:MAG: glutaredoxin 3 [Oligoflexia bacterium]|nr:MAG: glutaredoxin 3 [Oligoflexia bacterium]
MAKVVMYSKIPCPFCVNAKRLLNAKNIPFEEIDLTDRADEMQKIKEETGWRTVPIILIDGKLVGGFTDLKALDDSGELDKMVK